MIEEALIWTLRDSFPTKRTDYVAEIWRELFRFVTAIMMRGLRRTSTGTLWTRNQSKRKTEILLEMTLGGHRPKVEIIRMRKKGEKKGMRKCEKV